MHLFVGWMNLLELIPCTTKPSWCWLHVCSADLQASPAKERVKRWTKKELKSFEDSFIALGQGRTQDAMDAVRLNHMQQLSILITFSKTQQVLAVVVTDQIAGRLSGELRADISVYHPAWRVL